MQTSLDPTLAHPETLTEVDRILRSCVHCGFCTSGCPTYQLLGDENDSPRGRIYLMKQAFEGDASFDAIAPHLDRCLTCRNCETNCPSGVDYSGLLDITRGLMFEQANGSLWRRLRHAGVKWLLRQRWLMRIGFAIGRVLRTLPGLKNVGWLPFPRIHTLRRVPQTDHSGREQPRGDHLSSKLHRGKVLLLKGCLQHYATPGTTQALERILVRHGFEATYLDSEACCGALPYHMGDHDTGLRDLSELDRQLQASSREWVAVLSSASGCAAMLKQMDALPDPQRGKSTDQPSTTRRVMDPVTFLVQLPPLPVKSIRVAVHQPCTQSHALNLTGQVADYLGVLGFEVTGSNQGEGCCGSAGTYSLLEPRLASALRNQMLGQLEQAAPDIIVTANVGCQVHLDAAGKTPVMHWLELLDRQLI
jgi:glycolate oxidase iron-sulfur subunit